MRVLVADDDAACREVLAGVLREEGHDVIVAQDGSEAWGILQNPRSPRLVFLDWTMPGMEGPEVCQRLRRREDGNHVYVIMLTANGGMEHLREAFEAGVNDFVGKTASVEELLARVLAARRFAKVYEELVSAQETIHQLRRHDVLTGLESRRMVLEVLQKEMVRATDIQSSLGLALIKVDHFDMIRDVYGHKAAEDVLREAARLISSSIRPYDLAGRYDEDEFVLAAPDFDLERMTALAEQLRKALAATPVHVGKETIAFTVSIGLAITDPASNQDAGDLTDLAHNALYQAGKGDGNRVAANPMASAAAANH